MTGFGIVEFVDGKLVCVTCGCIRTGNGELPDRLRVILRDLATVIAQHHPTEVAVEKVFVNVNPQSTLLLGQARGAAISAAVSPISGRRIHGAAGEAGVALTWKGRAEQVQNGPPVARARGAPT